MCPKCKSTKTEVLDSRKNQKHQGSVWRRRACKKCFKMWSTIEVRQDIFDDLFGRKDINSAIQKLENSAGNIVENIKKNLQR